MATIPMIPVGPVTSLNRSILQPERRMSGTGGDDFICGHCGSVVLEDFDPSTVRGKPVDLLCWRISILRQSEGNLSISARLVKTTTIYRSLPQAITGPHGDPTIVRDLSWRRAECRHGMMIPEHGFGRRGFVGD
jgi:hypothetical protein